MFDIITDSACDIVREYAETHNLKLVPLYTTFDGVNYLKEQYDITHDEFYRRMTVKYSSDSVVNIIRPSFLKASRTLIVSSYEYPAFLKKLKSTEMMLKHSLV